MSCEGLKFENKTQEINSNVSNALACLLLVVGVVVPKSGALGLHVEFSKSPGHETLPLGALGSPWGGSPWGELNLFVYP